MKVLRKVTAYDKLTERLAFDVDLPDEQLEPLARSGGYASIGAVPLTHQLVEEIAPRLHIPAAVIDRCDWFLEPFASEEALIPSAQLS